MKSASCREKLAGEIEIIFVLRLAEVLMPLRECFLKSGSGDVVDIIENTATGARRLVERILEKYDVRISSDWLIEGLSDLEENPDLDQI
ncbi:MAG: hypothetical protein WCX65_15460 [bacterium]